MGRLTSSGARLSRPVAAPSPAFEPGFRRPLRSAAVLLLFAGALFAGLAHQAQAQTGIVLSTAALTVAEGDSADYTVRLNTQPTGNVTVTVARASGGSGEVTFDTSAATGVSSIVFATSPASGDTFGLGEVIGVVVTFDAGGITITGTPQVALTIGSATRHATYASHRDFDFFTNLRFDYTVQAATSIPTG